MRIRFTIPLCALIVSTSAGLLWSRICAADGPQDNRVDNVRPVPPPGVPVPEADRAELTADLEALGKMVDSLKANNVSQDLLADVAVYHKAVRYALQYNEFFRPQEIGVAKQLLHDGTERAVQLLGGKAPWSSQTGLVVRGYVSKIDGSVQPFGLVIPESYPSRKGPVRLDCWFHGRGETLSEVNFINDRQRNMGDFTPPDTIVLHLYGRYCCANKLAGEADLFEALACVKRQYAIDPNRIVVRGFSMGGAACWQFATHFAGDWAAAAPGAGFSETADFLKVFQRETVQPTWYEQKLWHMYDCTDYALNLFNCPTIAYSGEIDSQKQAADMMEKALAKEGMTLVHLIGPKTAHAYEPNTKKELARRIDELAQKGREICPNEVKFVTYTLQYHKMRWVQLDGLEKHWERAQVDARLNPTAAAIDLKTKNVTGLTLDFPAHRCSLAAGRRPVVDIDGTKIKCGLVSAEQSFTAHFRKSGSRWALVSSTAEKGLHKRPGLQGPIDHALMDGFLFVRPTGKPMNERVGAWAKAEMDHAVMYWRKQHRGDVRIKDDNEVTADDIAHNNLILWGDPWSNKLIAKIGPKLPIVWNAEGIHIGKQILTAGQHALITVYPNPLNPNRYVVFNSSFTWREYDALNNARQIPKLPDWAVVDTTTPPNSRWPGKIVDAGFYGERWELMPSH